MLPIISLKKRNSFRLTHFVTIPMEFQSIKSVISSRSFETDCEIFVTWNVKQIKNIVFQKYSDKIVQLHNKSYWIFKTSSANTFLLYIRRQIDKNVSLRENKWSDYLRKVSFTLTKSKSFYQWFYLHSQ